MGQGLLGGDHDGRLLIYGDAEAYRAYGDTQTGLVAVGKAAPGEDDAHHELRRTQALTRMKRVKARLAEIAARVKGGKK